MEGTNLAAAARLLWNIIEFYGHDPAGVFRQEGLDPEKFHDPRARFPTRHVHAAWRRAQALIADPCFGLHGARAWHPAMLGALGFAWLASPTLRKAFERVARYSRLVTDSASIRVTETDMSLIEISYILGFSEASSFSRAFKRWTGRTPSTLRCRGREYRTNG